VVFFLFAFLAFSVIDQASFEDFQFINRLSNIGADSDDNLIARGYGALLNPDLRIFYGWGEGYTLEGHPGATPEHGLEVHSTFGGVLIGYGLFGFIIFAAFFIHLVARVSSKVGVKFAIIIFLPTFFYGLTHNGIRFTIFWIFLAAVTYFAFCETRHVKRLSTDSGSDK
jgi:hypothetical protein